MKNYKIAIAALALAVSFTSCKKDFENPVGDTNYTSGEADFSTYVALGNSLTSGYCDGALYASAQKQSFPSILAKSMMMAGGGEFNQPLMPNDRGGFANLGVSGKMELQVVNGSLAPVPTAAITDLDNIANYAPFQNLGVPGAKLIHLIAPGYGNPAGIAGGLANPYYARFATSANASVVGDAMAQSPTFFSLWIGNNDVLGYATTGGAGDTITGELEFKNTYDALLQQLTADGAKGVVANIPSITDIPFFTTVPYRFIPLSDGMVDTLTNSTFGAVAQIINNADPTRDIKFEKGVPNRILVKDRSLSDLSQTIAAALIQVGRPVQEAQAMGYVYGQCRMSTPEDLVLLTAPSTVGQLDSTILAIGGPSAAPLAVIGITAPSDALVLDPSEQSKISIAIGQYNAQISTMATDYGLALYDANAQMRMLTSESGIIYNAVSYTANYITGGAFSLDGVHPTPRGYAIIANGFIGAINAKYHSNLPMVNPNNYTGIELP